MKLKIDTVIVTTYGNDLLQQRYDVLLEDNNIHNLVIQRKYSVHNDLDLFLINSKNKVLVLSRNEKNLNNIIDGMTKQELDRTLMVFDDDRRPLRDFCSEILDANEINDLTPAGHKLLYDYCEGGYQILYENRTRFPSTGIGFIDFYIKILNDDKEVAI